MSRIDVTGQVFGRLTVQSMIYQPRCDSRAQCLCTCGGVTVVLVYNLRNGNTTSCGCRSREVAAERGRVSAPPIGHMNATHGMSKTSTYQSWRDMKLRCTDPNNGRFKWYGAKGVTVCCEWLSSFEAFLRDMGEKPIGLTLDRIRATDGYGPGNCRWASRRTQSRNRPGWVKLSYEKAGEIRSRSAAGETVPSLSAAFGVSRGAIDMVISGKTWARPDES